MSPDTARLVVLLAEVRADRAALEDQVRRVRGALASDGWDPDGAILAVVAVALHHYYGAAESIFERIAKCFEGVPARADRWHRELLDRMALELDGLRPALIGPETRRGLGELLAFRHFFRHAYAVALDPARLRERAEDLIRVHAMLAADLEDFERVMAAAAGAQP